MRIIPMNGYVNPWKAMQTRIKNMSDDALRTVWKSLEHYDPKEFYEGRISMDDWAEAVYSEITIRALN